MKLTDIKKKYAVKSEIMSLDDYFGAITKDPSLYASPAERMLKAIGEPEIIDTATIPELSRRFSNRKLKHYKSFDNFYGMEQVIEQIVSFFQHAAQGLEEQRQILYLLGPVGSAKSSLAEKLKSLMETQPFYAIEGSPIYESPLGLLRVFPELQETYQIPAQYIPACASPWLVSKLDELGGDISKLRVIKLYPSQSRQIAITKTEPGDENNQDISTLVGKLDIRKLEHYAQDDPNAYRFNGGLCLGNRGIMEFVEIFKAPIKTLHPLLTATQEGNYKGTEQLGPIPFEGIIVSHSNESEFLSFKNNKNNEAFLDRICIIKVPYNLAVDEEVKIYKKYIKNSSLHSASVAPYTLKLLAEYAVLSRLKDVDGTDAVMKMKVYNGDNVKELYPDAKSFQQLKDDAPLTEGFDGLSTRAAFKVLSNVFNYDIEEKAANPVHLLLILTETIKKDDISDDEKDRLLAYIQEWLIPSYLEEVQKDIQSSYLDSYSEYAQHLFDHYLARADAWIEENDYRDPDTGTLYDKRALDSFLSELEKPAKISNPKDFRHEAVKFNYRYQAKHDGKNLPWDSNQKFKEVLEKKLFTKTSDLLPQISFSKHATDEDKKKQQNYVSRMKERGYTERQVQLVTKFFEDQSKSS